MLLGLISLAIAHNEANGGDAPVLEPTPTPDNDGEVLVDYDVVEHLFSYCFYIDSRSKIRGNYLLFLFCYFSIKY